MAKKKGQELDKLTPWVRVSLQVKVGEGDKVFGPGVARLCKGVQELGSLNRAAQAMGMAYSKAWRIMKGIEGELGFCLLDRDGARGSRLTEQGQRLLSVYQALSDKVNEFAQTSYLSLIQAQ